MQQILLKNCLSLDYNDSVIKTDILVENAKIKAVSPHIDYEDKNTHVIDIREKYVFPGLIDCHTHIGIIEEATGQIGIDNNETSDPVTPHLRGIDAINPFDLAFHDAVISGVTTVMSGPGSNNVVGGLSVALKTHGEIIDNMVIRNPLALKISLGENPLNTYGVNDKAPVTRMGIVSLIRELFMRAQDYMEQKRKGNIITRDIRLEAVIPVLTNQIALRAHAHRADDIVTAIRIAEEFGINKLIIEHGTEADLVKNLLKEKNIPVAIGPMFTARAKIELKRRHYGTIVELAEAGIKTALITDHPYNLIDQLRTIAIISISEELSHEDAIKSITSNPADILECSDKIGKLHEGYDADIVVYDKHPLDINAKVSMTMINGKIIYKKDTF